MIGDDVVAEVLYRLATGSSDRALEIIASTEQLDDPARESLREALAESTGPSEQARRLGDGLRALGAPRHLVNECYRVSFYSGDGWKRLSSDPLYAYFAANRSAKPLDKWPHYFPIYHRHLQRYRDRPVKVLEIGVYRGGGLGLLRHYLGPGAVIVGIDIDESSVRAAGDDFTVELGDQADRAFLARVAERHGPFDIIIDDGGHQMHQQIASVEALFPALVDDGIYIVEDCHTSFWDDYRDRAGGDGTFLEWVKERVDDLHAYHFSSEREMPEPWQTTLAAVHVYDSVVVLDKAPRFPPFSELSGTNEYIGSGRIAQAEVIEAIATRDDAIATRDAARDEATALREELHTTSTRLESELAAAQAELALTRGALHDSQEIVLVMQESTSWRVTAPLRRMVSLLRR